MEAKLFLLAFAALMLAQMAWSYSVVQKPIVHPYAQSDDLAGSGHISMSSDGRTLAFAVKTEFANTIGSVYVYFRSDDEFDYQAGPLLSLEITQRYSFGESVALSGDGKTLVVSASADDNYRGAVVVFHYSEGNWTQLGSKLLEESPAENNKFSKGKISISADGLFIAAGNAGSNGKVTLFHRNENGIYELNQTISLGAGAATMQTLLSADGSTLLVGATLNSDNYAFWVYSYQVQTSTWIARATQIPLYPAPAARLQSAISSDGRTLAFTLSGPIDFNGGHAAVVYDFDGNSYVLTQRIIDPDYAPETNENSISFFNNGTQLIIGKPEYESGIGGAMIFQRTDQGWIKTISRVFAKVESRETAAYQRQGHRLAITEDGQWLALSAPYFSVLRDPYDTGGIFVFSKDFTPVPTQAPYDENPSDLAAGTKYFQQTQKVVLENLRPFDGFGSGLAISGDGKTTVVTAPYRYASESVRGGLFIYTRLTDNDEWELSAGPVFAQASITETFGFSSIGLAISGDGSIIAAAAPLQDNHFGAIGVIRLQNGSWVPFGDALTREVRGIVYSPTVAISADGSILATGGDPYGSIGGVEIYTRTETGYIRYGPRLIGSDGAGLFDQGSRGISLSADGKTVAFSNPYDNNAKGAIWVFKCPEEAGAYTQVGNKLANEDAYLLGNYFAMSSDGTTIVSWSDPRMGQIKIGFLVFKYNHETNTYSSQSPVTNVDPWYLNSLYWYPGAIALSGSGDELLLSQMNVIRQTLIPSGGITLFTKTPNGTFQVSGYNFTGVPQNRGVPMLDLGFGDSMAISADGTRLVASAKDDDANKGAIYFFDLMIATGSPSTAPSTTPSFSPSNSPSQSPSKSPSLSPSATPSASPTLSAPSFSPSTAPSQSPSKSPSLSPSATPSARPTLSAPSASPNASSFSPSNSPERTPDPRCTGIPGMKKKDCQKRNKKICTPANWPMKWTGRACKMNGKRMRDGGCQCKGFCGYLCKPRCNKDKDCYWQDNACYRKGTNILHGQCESRFP